MILAKLDRSQATRVAIAFAAWTLASLILATQAWVSGAMRGEPVAWWPAFATWFVWASIWALLTPLVVDLAARTPLRPPHIPRSLVIHGAAGFALAAINLAIFAVFAQQLGSINAGKNWLETYTRLLGASFFLNVPVYWLIVAAAHSLQLARSARERERRALQLEAQLADARLLALRAQLQPHLLFNALNTISVLMREDTERADRVLVLLSNLLRRALDTTAEQEVPLGIEIELLEAYLSIEQTRFGNRLEYRLQIDPLLLQARVPSLILQPLVENAVRHGLAERATVGRIEVTARRRHDMLELCVRDNGIGIAGEAGEDGDGVGLSNTRARLKLLYNERHRFELHNHPDGGLSVELVIPLRIDQGP